MDKFAGRRCREVRRVRGSGHKRALTRRSARAVSARERAASALERARAPNIYISDAFHDATINIDEEGTVAAATAFVGVTTSAPPTPARVAFDHPFVCFVRDSSAQSQGMARAYVT
jgi:serine protease inhibitor